MAEDTLAPPDAVSIDDDDTHIEQWKRETDGIDRVISIALTSDRPRTAEQVADEAHVSEATARKHLERLVELHVLSAVEQRGAKTYAPDSAYQRFREVAQLTEEHDREEIQELTVKTQEEIEELEAEYEVSSPEELRAKATADETTAAEAREFFQKASQWDQEIHLLSIAEEALRRYDEFSSEASAAQHTPV